MPYTFFFRNTSSLCDYRAMRCSVLQCVAVCCSVLQCVVKCCSSWSLFSYLIHEFCVWMPDTLFFACLFCVTIELCVAVSCSVLQCVAALHLYFHISYMYSVFACPMLSLMYVFPLWLYSCALQCIAVCYSVLQHVAAYCSVLQRVAACCSSSSSFSYLIHVSCVCMPHIFPFVCLSCVIIGLTTEIVDQLDWLEETLAQSSADWLIVIGHYPVRCNVLERFAVCCSVLQSS